MAATGSNSGSASIGPVLLSGTGAGAGSSGTGLNSDPNSPVLSSQYTGGSTTGGQGNGTAGTLTNADLWRLYWSGVGAGSSSARSDEGSLADDPTISAQYTGGSGIGRITPLVYNPESDGPPVFHSGVWTGDDGSVQFVQTADTGNQGTGESDASQSDGKSRERSWWGLWGWFLGDDPAQGSLWKSGPSDVLRPGDIGTYNDGKSQSESLEDAGKATKELIDGAGRDAALAVVGGVVGKLQGAPKTLGEVNLKGTIQGYGKTLADEGKFFGWKSSSVSKAADNFTKEQLGVARQ